MLIVADPSPAQVSSAVEYPRPTGTHTELNAVRFPGGKIAAGVLHSASLNARKRKARAAEARRANTSCTRISPSRTEE